MSGRVTPPQDQPGYDALADLYADTFPTPFQSDLERHVVDCFVDMVQDREMESTVVDIGCGLGHVAAHIATHGCRVVGVDPSPAMLAHARRTHPTLEFLDDDARAESAPLESCAGILARFSLIHIAPALVPGILSGWRRRVRPGTLLLVAAQSADERGAHEFDHVVARAWRWHPDALADVLRANGFDEAFRTLARADQSSRFSTAHLVARAGDRPPS